MGKLIVSFIIIAAVATAIAFAATYWYYFLGAGAVGYGIYAFRQKRIDKENQV